MCMVRLSRACNGVICFCIYRYTSILIFYLILTTLLLVELRNVTEITNANRQQFMTGDAYSINNVNAFVIRETTKT